VDLKFASLYAVFKWRVLSRDSLCLCNRDNYDDDEGTLLTLAAKIPISCV